jgi:hypothetical protein
MKNRLLSFFVVAIAGFSYGQNATLSPYSYYSFGQPANANAAENNMMGGITVYADSTHFSLDNPATLKKLDYVQYRVGANYKSVEQTSNNGGGNTSSASLNYLSLSVPTKYFAFSFGLKPKTSLGYRMSVTGQLDELDTTTFYTGEGGVNTTFLGLAVTPIKGLSLGIMANYNFGFTEKVFTQNIAGVQLDTQILTRSELSGLNYVFGAHYDQRIKSKYILQLSATYTPKTSLESANTRTISSISTTGGIGSQEIIDFGSLANTSNKFSSETNLGAGFGVAHKWFVGVNYFNTSKGLTNPLELNTNVKYKATSRLSVGGFYIPKYNSFTSYISRVVYRVGTRFEKTGLVLNNQSIEDFGITFGLGLPVGGLSKINIGVELGQLGTLDGGLIKENYANIMLGFSLSDVWFIKRKYD